MITLSGISFSEIFLFWFKYSSQYLPINLGMVYDIQARTNFADHSKSLPTINPRIITTKNGPMCQNISVWGASICSRFPWSTPAISVDQSSTVWRPLQCILTACMNEMQDINFHLINIHHSQIITEFMNSKTSHLHVYAWAHIRLPFIQLSKIYEPGLYLSFGCIFILFIKVNWGNRSLVSFEVKTASSDEIERWIMSVCIAVSQVTLVWQRYSWLACHCTTVTACCVTGNEPVIKASKMKGAAAAQDPTAAMLIQNIIQKSSVWEIVQSLLCVTTQYKRLHLPI